MNKKCKWKININNYVAAHCHNLLQATKHTVYLTYLYSVFGEFVKKNMMASLLSQCLQELDYCVVKQVFD